MSAADRLESLITTEMGSHPPLPLSAPSSLVLHELLLKTPEIWTILVSRQSEKSVLGLQITLMLT